MDISGDDDDGDGSGAATAAATLPSLAKLKPAKRGGERGLFIA
jgi:hypothetical protein